jgi:prophage regulatory protein
MKATPGASLTAARRQHAALDFDALPDCGLVRIADLVRPGPLPCGAATIWRWVKAGKFPAPIKIGERFTAWPVSSVRAWLETQKQGVTFVH